MPENNSIIVSAFIWNQKQKFPGILSLKDDELHFQLEGFENSNLNIELHLSDLVEVEEFLLYDISLNGLYLKSRSGREDHFILDDPVAFRKAINSWRKRHPGSLRA